MDDNSKIGQMDNTTINQLIAAAQAAQEKAYAPYSNFRVGAALLTAAGQVITGCNVENAAYSLCNCAERTAVFTAVAAGQRDFQAIAIVGESELPCAPCGACRQVLVEFNPDLQVIMANPQGERLIMKAAELLPNYFRGGYLK